MPSLPRDGAGGSEALKDGVRFLPTRVLLHPLERSPA